MFSFVNDILSNAVRNSKLLARKYAELGLAVIPVSQGKKSPAIKGWQKLEISPEETESYFTEEDNIGLLLGRPSGLVDIDLDCQESRLIAPIFLKKLKPVAVYGRGKNTRSHYLFYTTDNTIPKPLKFSCPVSKETLLEIRSDGQQSLLPGSIHPSGDAYCFDECGEKAVVDGEKLIKSASRLAALALLIKHWPAKGSRNNATLALAGGLLRAGKTKEDVVSFIKLVAEITNDEEADERIRVVNYTAEKIEAGQPATGWPTLGEIIDRRVVAKFREWLQIEGINGQHGSTNRRQEVVEAIEAAFKKKEPGMAIMDDDSLMQKIALMKNDDIAGYDQVEKTVKGTVNLNNFRKAVKNVEQQNKDNHLEASDSSGLDIVRLGNFSLSEHRQAAYEILKKHNSKNPFLFRRSGELVHIRIDEKRNARIALVNLAVMQNILSDYICWSCGYDDKKKKELHAYPPPAVSLSILADVSLEFPHLSRIVKTPVFGANGSLLTRPGYHQEAGVWLLDDVSTVNIKDEPSKEDVFHARDFIKENVFYDFPFQDESGLAYSFAALLLNFVRQMIDGPTPLHLFDAVSGAGTGKSLLAEVLTTISTGGEPSVLTDTVSDEEWRKLITAKLMTGPNVILIDNIKRRLDSAALSAALTVKVWEGRLLGKSEIVSCPVDACWLATGNGVETSREMVRRLVRINLDAKTTQPWTRDPEGFKHKNLRSWVIKNRKELVEACLTIIQGWIVAGKPLYTEKSLGSYESWSAVIGGILQNAEIKGFLEDLSKIYEEADVETSSWREFLVVWWDEYSGKEVRVADLYELAKNNDLLLSILGYKSERSQKSRLGKALKAAAGRYVDSFFVEKVGNKGRGGVNAYRLLNDGNNNTIEDGGEQLEWDAGEKDLSTQIDDLVF